jgi:hypothetical protein
MLKEFSLQESRNNNNKYSGRTQTILINAVSFPTAATRAGRTAGILVLELYLVALVGLFDNGVMDESRTSSRQFLADRQT